MPTTVNDKGQLSAAMWVIEKRIAHHTEAGGIAEGMDYRTLSGKSLRRGQKDFPYLRCREVEVEERIFAGAKSGDGWRMNTAIQSVITADFSLVCDEAEGLTPEGSGSTGLLDWIAKACDAMETDTNGEADCSLEKSLASPIEFRVREPENSQAALEVVIEVTLKLQPVCRGQRSFTLPAR